MKLSAPSRDVFDFIVGVSRAYEKLTASSLADPEFAQGGKLFYAGELDSQGRALVVAANIAGAATLIASADRAQQKLAIRDGVVDFLVTSLDEALRILKNQLRKRETVSICVAIEPNAIELEMKARGVQPDLLRSAFDNGDHAPAIPSALLMWSVASAPAKWPPHLDAIALECLDRDAWSARRWLRLAPRYLGRMAQGIRTLPCSQESASKFIEHVESQVSCGEIAVPVEVSSRDVSGGDDRRSFESAKP